MKNRDIQNPCVEVAAFEEFKEFEDLRTSRGRRDGFLLLKYLRRDQLLSMMDLPRQEPAEIFRLYSEKQTLRPVQSSVDNSLAQNSESNWLRRQKEPSQMVEIEQRVSILRKKEARIPWAIVPGGSGWLFATCSDAGAMQLPVYRVVYKNPMGTPRCAPPFARAPRRANIDRGTLLAACDIRRPLPSWTRDRSVCMFG